jgi:hypothetical protein
MATLFISRFKYNSDYLDQTASIPFVGTPNFDTKTYFTYTRFNDPDPCANRLNPVREKAYYSFLSLVCGSRYFIIN